MCVVVQERASEVVFAHGAVWRAHWSPPGARSAQKMMQAAMFQSTSIAFLTEPSAERLPDEGPLRLGPADEALAGKISPMRLVMEIPVRNERPALQLENLCQWVRQTAAANPPAGSRLPHPRAVSRRFGQPLRPCCDRIVSENPGRTSY